MGAAIGEILPTAIGVAISPIPIIAVVLLLSTPMGRGNALSFLLGRLVGLGLVGLIVLVVADPAGASEDGGPALWVGWLFAVLGLLAVLIGIRSFLGRPRGDEEPPMPKWMAAIDDFNAGRSVAIRFVLAALNPKNLTLISPRRRPSPPPDSLLPRWEQSRRDSGRATPLAGLEQRHDHGGPDGAGTRQTGRRDRKHGDGDELRRKGCLLEVE